jgi:hypothetical protein
MQNVEEVLDRREGTTLQRIQDQTLPFGFFHDRFVIGYDHFCERLITAKVTTSPDRPHIRS